MKTTQGVLTLVLNYLQQSLTYLYHRSESLAFCSLGDLTQVHGFTSLLLFRV